MLPSAAAPTPPKLTAAGVGLFVGFGLSIRSEIDLPELLPGDFERSDVDIKFGDVPDHLGSCLASGVMFEASARHFLIKLPTVGKFLLTDGQTITVQPNPGTDIAVVRGLLLADVIPPLLRQRGLLVLHAGGVLTERGVILLAGRSGAGKSSLTAAFVQRGARLVCDDFAAVRRESDGSWLVSRGVSRIKLWEDAVLALGLDPSALPRVRPELKRYYLDVSSSAAPMFSPLTSICLLDTWEGSDVTVQRLTGQPAFRALRNQIRGVPAATKLGLDALHFREIAALAGRVPVFSVKRSTRSTHDQSLVDSVLAFAG